MTKVGEIHIPDLNQIIFSTTQNKLNYSLILIATKSTIEIIQKTDELYTSNVRFWFEERLEIKLVSSVIVHDIKYLVVVDSLFNLYIFSLETLFSNENLAKQCQYLARTSLLENSVVNTFKVSEDRMWDLVSNSAIQFDDDFKMIYFVVHDD